MIKNFNETRKIDPTKGTMVGDNTPNDMDRVEIGPTKWHLVSGPKPGSSYQIYKKCDGLATKDWCRA